jgi:hypothetical protein
LCALLPAVVVNVKPSHCAGPAFAEKWYNEGYRTIRAIAARDDLNPPQRLGVRYFDEMQTLITLDEARAIDAYIREVYVALPGPAMQHAHTHTHFNIRSARSLTLASWLKCAGVSGGGRRTARTLTCSSPTRRARPVRLPPQHTSSLHPPYLDCGLP